ELRVHEVAVDEKEVLAHGIARAAEREVLGEKEAHLHLGGAARGAVHALTHEFPAVGRRVVGLSGDRIEDARDHARAQSHAEAAAADHLVQARAVLVGDDERIDDLLVGCAAAARGQRGDVGIDVALDRAVARAIARAVARAIARAALVRAVAPGPGPRPEHEAPCAQARRDHEARDLPDVGHVHAYRPRRAGPTGR